MCMPDTDAGLLASSMPGVLASFMGEVRGTCKTQRASTHRHPKVQFNMYVSDASVQESLELVMRKHELKIMLQPRISTADNPTSNQTHFAALTLNVLRMNHLSC